MLTPYPTAAPADPRSGTTKLPSNPEELRILVEKMQDRERRLMDLLKISSPDRIEHDVRNVLNELVLLRALFDPQSTE